MINGHRSTIVFANSRRLAERLTAHLNELQAEPLGEGAGEAPPPAQVMAESGASDGPRRHNLSGDRPGAPRLGQQGATAPRSRTTSSRVDCRAWLPPHRLELGIDMGAVDIVVQVEPPPSVASGLQRVGRAGHQVGARHGASSSQPSRRPDRVAPWWSSGCGRAPSRRSPSCATRWTCSPSRSWPRSPSRRPRPMSSTRWSAEPQLPGPALQRVRGRAGHAQRTLSERGLRRAAPRLVWQRDTGLLTARPGAQRLAVTSGGTIPDRGLFGVFLVGEGNASGRHALAAESASSTRRWSTRPGSATSSPSAPPAGGSSRSPTTRCWSPPPPALRVGCRSGRATRRAGRWSSDGPSAVCP